MCDRPGDHELRAHLDAQAVLLRPLTERLATWLGVNDVSLVHAALLPVALASGLDLEPYPVITCEAVREAFRTVAPPLQRAL